MHESINNTRHSEITPRTQTDVMLTGLVQTELLGAQNRLSITYLPRTYSSKVRRTHWPRASKPLAQKLNLTACVCRARHGRQRMS